jgi:uncharacterized membrane protein YtjA (UPF0391 family)
MPAGNLLYYALVALVIALIAGFLGFGGIAGTAAGIAQVLFYIFLIIFLVVVVMNFMGRNRGPRLSLRNCRCLKVGYAQCSALKFPVAASDLVEALTEESD